MVSDGKDNLINYENNEVTNVNDDIFLFNNVYIKKNKKNILDLRCGMVTQEEHSAANYYFVNQNDKRIPVIDLNGNEIYDDFYSIEKIDEFHYKVSTLDFTYSEGLDSYLSIYGRNFSEAWNYFKFHYGVVAIKDNKIQLIVPTVYKDIKITNSNVVIVQADDEYKPVYDDGKLLRIEKVDGKLGAINIDSESDLYGFNIIPTVLDHFEDFDLKYKGFACVGIGEITGYLAKEIDMDRYKDYLKLFSSYKQGMIDMKTYQQSMKEAIKGILIPDNLIENYIKDNKSKKLIKSKDENN